MNRSNDWPERLRRLHAEKAGQQLDAVALVRELRAGFNERVLMKRPLTSPPADSPTTPTAPTAAAPQPDKPTPGCPVGAQHQAPHHKWGQEATDVAKGVDGGDATGGGLAAQKLQRECPGGPQA
jgi:hypothetical protein